MSEIEKFWKIVRVDDFEVRSEGLDEWSEFERKNPKHFENMKNRFTKIFYKTYSGKVLHDFNVLDIEIKCNTMPARKSEIRILIYDVYEDYGKDVYFYLVYRDVQAYAINIPRPNLETPWYLDIFEEIDEDTLKHRISLTGNGYIEITFKTISMIRVKKEDINI